MKASVIVLTKNAGQGWEKLLQRLFSQRFDGEYEVIVIDSGSTDATVEIARRYPVRLVQIPPQEFHHGRTRNLGAELSSGEILVYITQDALPLRDDWLQKLVDNFADPSVAMVCGRQIPWEYIKPPEKFLYYYSFPEFKVRVESGVTYYFHDSLFISNVNSAYSKETWSRFRFSDKVLLGEDVEIANRILSRGYAVVYEPEAPVYHAHNFSLSQLFRRYALFGTALTQGAALSPRSRNWVARRLGYIFQEMKFVLSQKRWWYWLPYSIAYELAKLLGIACGYFSHLLRQRQVYMRQG